MAEDPIPLENLNNNPANAAPRAPEEQENEISVWDRCLGDADSPMAIEKRLFKLAAIFAAFLWAVIYAVKYFFFTPKDANLLAYACHSFPCNRTVQFMQESMNTSVDPCHNFYDFVCGKFDANSSSKISMIRSGIVSQLENSIIFYSLDDYAEYLQKLQKYYESCSDENLTDSNGKIDLKKVFDKIGGWPILNEIESETELDWIDVIRRFREEGLPFNYFFEFSIHIDVKNNTKKIIHLYQPSFLLPREFLIQGLNNSAVRAYKSLMVNVTKIMGAKDNIEQEVEKVLEFEVELAKISQPLEELGFLWETYKATSVGDLESAYPGIRWLDYLNGILAPYTKIDESEIVYLIVPSYFKKLSELMTERKAPNSVLVNYAFWRATLSLVDYLGDAVSSSYAQYFFDITGKQYNVEIINRCLKRASSHLHLATSALYLQKYVKENFPNNEERLELVRQMAENIRNVFRQEIQKVNWLADGIKKEIVDKISQIALFVGYPKELLNDTKLDAYYEDLRISNSSFIMTELNYNKFKLKKKIESFLKPNNLSDWTWVFGYVINSEPMYSPQNALYLSQGMLQDRILFDESFPHYMNYAMLGFVVAHEMAYVLATQTRFFDKKGQLRDSDFWDSKSTEMYLNRTNCFVEEYKNYLHKQIGVEMSGKQTLSESMADNIGLRVAYYAFVDAMTKKPSNQVLDPYKNYTPKQMFWITFGSTLCEKVEVSMKNIEKMVLTSSHAPMKFRVVESVTSLPEFANDFNCKTKDVMNPPDKCTMW